MIRNLYKFSLKLSLYITKYFTLSIANFCKLIFLFQIFIRILFIDLPLNSTNTVRRVKLNSLLKPKKNVVADWLFAVYFLSVLYETSGSVICHFVSNRRLKIAIIFFHWLRLALNILQSSIKITIHRITEIYVFFFFVFNLRQFEWRSRARIIFKFFCWYLSVKHMQYLRIVFTVFRLACVNFTYTWNYVFFVKIQHLTSKIMLLQI